LIANRVGNFMLQIDAATAGYASERLENSWWQAFVDFFQMAGVTVVGFLVMAIVSAALGYVLSSAVWRVLVARRRAKRLALMEARLDRRLNAN